MARSIEAEATVLFFATDETHRPIDPDNLPRLARGPTLRRDTDPDASYQTLSVPTSAITPVLYAIEAVQDELERPLPPLLVGWNEGNALVRGRARGQDALKSSHETLVRWSSRGEGSKLDDARNIGTHHLCNASISAGRGPDELERWAALALAFKYIVLIEGRMSDY